MQYINYEKTAWQFSENWSPEQVINTLKSSVWKIVKTNPKRTVYKVGKFYVKIYSFKGIAGFFKRKYSNGARKEWLISKRLFEPFKEIPEPVTFGMSNNLSILITRSVEPCMNMSEFVSSRWSKINNKKRYQIVDRFAGFIIRLCQAGLFQKDFNTGNILISDDYSKFFAIDLQYAKLKNNPLTEQQTAQNLSYLLPPFYQKINKRYLIRFFITLLKTYPKLNDYAAKIENKAFALMRRQWLRKNRRKLKERALESNLITKSNIIGYIKSGLDPNMANELIAKPDSIFRHSVKDFKYDNFSRISLIDLNGKEYLLKYYTLKKIIPKIKHRPFGSYAWNIWEKANLVSDRHIVTPVLYAAIEVKKGLNKYKLYALYKYINGATGVKKFFSDKSINKNVQKKALRKLAELLWKMHQTGIYLRNADINDFILEKDNINIIFTGINNVRFVGKVNNRQRYNGLKKLISSLKKINKEEEILNVIIDTYQKNGNFSKTSGDQSKNCCLAFLRGAI